jgi:hypothetical protein
MIPIPVPITMDGLKQVSTWIQGIFNWKHIHDEAKKAEIKNALEALLTAVRETRQYLAIVNAHPLKKDFATEGHLSQLWGAAGVTILPIDEQLAYRYIIKADYWSDRDGWLANNKDTLLIELDEVARLGREALIGN